MDSFTVASLNALQVGGAYIDKCMTNANQPVPGTQIRQNKTMLERVRPCCRSEQGAVALTA